DSMTSALQSGARAALSICLITCLAACALQPRSEEVNAAAGDNALLWFRNSLERKAIYLQTFANAEARLTAIAATRPPGDWGVILDVDETVPDNSEYSLQQSRRGKSFDEKTWEAWVQARRAVATPGARDF